MADTVSDLLPCPFCGNDGSGPVEDALHIAHSQCDWHPAYDVYAVQCDKCTATMGYSESEDAAAEAWNTRASTQPAPAFPREEVAEAIRQAKVEADKVYGVAWYNLEEISRVELILAALLQGKQP